jgi:NAD(P)H-nitrite reductase large subunit
MHYVIIGNSTAAIGCIEGIRRLDATSPITVISNEPYHTYSRPLISYLLQGKTDEQRMKYRPNDFYEKNHVTTLLGKFVTEVHPEKYAVLLENGEVLSYDKLLLATGSRPFIPEIKGFEKIPKKTTFMSIDDAKNLSNMINKDSHVLVVGAGLIGLKCVEGIADRVSEITVVDLADRILPRILDEKGSHFVQEFLEKHGVQFYLKSSVSEFTENTAILQDGTKIPYDVVVMAVGVRPNIEIAQNAEVLTQRAVCINEKSETSLPDIYAAGDCSECKDLTTERSSVIAILPNAYLQGETAGLNMAGGNKRYDRAFPMNAIGFFGLHMLTAGSYEGESHIIEDENSYKKLITKDNLLKGFIMIGNVERAGIYTSLIREKTPLDSIDFDLIMEKPQLMAFSHAERAKKLGGVR